MKNIGMIVAVEIQAVVSKYAESAERLDFPGFLVMKYACERYNLYILHCGAGEIAAAAGTQFLITKFGVDFVLNFGVVGGLTDEMTITKTCIVESVLHYDFDTSAVDGTAIGHYSAYPAPHIPTDKGLVDLATAIHPELKRVVCASGDKFIADSEKKRQMSRDFGADICEMEAAGILLTCNRNLVPCLMIKSVSDGITGGAEEFTREVNRAADICLEIAGKVIDNM